MRVQTNSTKSKNRAVVKGNRKQEIILRAWQLGWWGSVTWGELLSGHGMGLGAAHVLLAACA